MCGLGWVVLVLVLVPLQVFYNYICIASKLSSDVNTKLVLSLFLVLDTFAAAAVAPALLDIIKSTFASYVKLIKHEDSINH